MNKLNTLVHYQSVSSCSFHLCQNLIMLLLVNCTHKVSVCTVVTDCDLKHLLMNVLVLHYCTIDYCNAVNVDSVVCFFYET